MVDLKKLMAKVTVVGDHKKEYESPIPCKGYQTNTPDSCDYDCGYEHAGLFGCEDCICVKGGTMDPRTGKRYYVRKKRKKKA